MDETRRFLRYVVPALVFLTEVALLLLVTQKGCLIGGLSTRLKTDSAGFIALLVALAGGFGYLFSLVHHTLFWRCGKYGIDHREFVKSALAHGWLSLVTYGERNDIAGECVTRGAAEDVITILWYRPGRTQNAKDPELGEVLVRRTDALSDLVHGLGTGFIGVICALPAWAALYFWLCHEPLHSFWPDLLFRVLGATGLWVGLIALHLSNYWRVRNLLTRLVEGSLATHFAQTDVPAVIFVDRSALTRKRRRGDGEVLPRPDLPAS